MYFPWQHMENTQTRRQMDLPLLKWLKCCFIVHLCCNLAMPSSSSFLCCAIIFQFPLYLKPGDDRYLIYWLAWELGSKYIENWKIRLFQKGHTTLGTSQVFPLFNYSNSGAMSFFCRKQKVGGNHQVETSMCSSKW